MQSHIGVGEYRVNSNGHWVKSGSSSYQCRHRTDSSLTVSADPRVEWREGEGRDENQLDDEEVKSSKDEDKKQEQRPPKHGGQRCVLGEDMSPLSDGRSSLAVCRWENIPVGFGRSCWQWWQIFSSNSLLVRYQLIIFFVLNLTWL